MTRHFFVGLVLSLVLAAPCAAQSARSDSSHPDAEKVAAAALDDAQASDWKKYADLVHPDSLKEFRGILAPLLEDARTKAESEQAVLLQFFEGGDDVETVLGWSPSEFFVRFMQRAGAGANEPETKSSVRIVGTVSEGADQAHTVARVTQTWPNGSKVESVTVVSLKKSDGEWRLVPTEWQQLAASLRLSLGNAGVQEAIGEPMPDQPDR